MFSPVDIARAERETLRWILLLATWYARPYGVSEAVLVRCAHDIPLRVTPDQVRQELNHLAGHNLLKINAEAAHWHVSIGVLGEDVVDYRAPAPLGVARPPRFGGGHGL